MFRVELVAVVVLSSWYVTPHTESFLAHYSIIDDFQINYILCTFAIVFIAFAMNYVATCWQ